MQFKHFGLVPVFALMASTAFAAGSDDNANTNGLTLVDARCASGDDLATIFMPPCGKAQNNQRVASSAKALKADRGVARTKKLTEMPWQIGIFQ